MNEYEYLQEIKENVGFKESMYSVKDIEKEKAYLVYKGRAYQDSWTGEFIYIGYPEMGA